MRYRTSHGVCRLAHVPTLDIVGERPQLQREVLERLYVREGLSLKQVAERLGPPISKRMVQRALERFGIPMRPARPPAFKQEALSRELLERLYVDEGRSLPEVADIVGVSQTTLKKRMNALGIPRRASSWRSVGDRPAPDSAAAVRAACRAGNVGVADR